MPPQEGKQAKPAFTKGRITGWYCNIYNTYNDILDLSCIYCKSCTIPIQLIELSYRTRHIRTGEFIDMKTEDLIELHTRFYNAEKVIIADLDDAAMHLRLEELNKIIYEAKARKDAINEEDRQRAGKRSRSEREWLLNSGSNDPSVTDAIAAVKVRKERMSKADKLSAMLTSLGVANSDALVTAAIRNQTGSAITSVPTSDKAPVKTREAEQTSSAFCLNNQHHNCTGSYIIGGENHSNKCECKCHKPKVKVDLSTIQFAKKG